MSSFNKSQDTNNGPSKDKLRDWGESERTMPPIRRGRFANVAARLTDTVTPTSLQFPRLKPIIALGGASVVAATIGIVALTSSFTKTDSTSVHAVAPTQDASLVQTPTKRNPVANFGNGLSVTADPVFRSQWLNVGDVMTGREYATVPFVVSFKNDGPTVSGKIVVTCGTNDVRRYEYPVTVPGNGAELRKIVYAGMSRSYPRNYCEIVLEVGSRHVILSTANQTDNSNTYNDRVVAVLDKRLDVLSPRRNDYKNNNTTRDYMPFFAEPKNAPDRAAGYDTVDAVVLGEGCENLTATQWGALREWVKGGGSLVLVGVGSAAEALHNPIARELDPLVVADKAAGVGAKQNSGNGERTKPGTETIPSLGTDRSNDPFERSVARSSALRAFGLGSVTHLSFDPFDNEFRSHPNVVTTLWNSVTHRANTAFDAQYLRGSANTSPWFRTEYDQQTGRYYTIAQAGSNNSANDPFRATLPPLRTVVYIFLGYFVLVVPVSFVILKQTRRMQYAWFTGPVLATTFAGGIALLTTNLYTAVRSERTAGIVTMIAGERNAHFQGFTELYMPQAGTYTIDVPGTFRATDNQGSRSSYDYSNDQGGSRSGNSFTTSDAGTGESPVSIQVPNLSFRRVFHQQTMSLGEGITANLSVDPSGKLVGSIQNNTGLPLSGASVVLRGGGIKSKHQYGSNQFRWVEGFKLKKFSLGMLRPGSNSIQVPVDQKPSGAFPTAFDGSTDLNIDTWQRSYVPTKERFTLSSSLPLLIARTSGDSFGPRNFGKIVGGDSSVTVLIRLPALSDTSSTSLKGGNAQ